MLSDQVCGQTNLTKINHAKSQTDRRPLCNVTFSLFFILSDKKNIENTLKSSIFLYLSFNNYKLLTNRTTSINWQKYLSESRSGILHEASVHGWNKILSQKLIFSHFCNLYIQPLLTKFRYIRWKLLQIIIENKWIDNPNSNVATIMSATIIEVYSHDWYRRVAKVATRSALPRL